jgi:Flp pilus assembly protein TadG
VTSLEPIDETGGAPAVEAAILAVVIGVVIAFVLAAGRVTAAESAADQAARAAARTASIARDPGQAQAAATEEARRVLGEQDLTCDAVTVTVHAAPATGPAGDPAGGIGAGAGGVARAAVTCAVRWSDLGLPGAPGTHEVTAEFTSPFDQYRERP